MAPQFDVTLTDVQATASCRADAAGLLGVEGADPALAGIAPSIRLASPDPAERVDAMLTAWRERCPMALRPPRRRV